MIRLQSLRGTEALQNLAYTYDPVGNITHIQDQAQQTIYFRNQIIEPSNNYTYDAIYRLISATGREHLGQTGGRANAPTAPDAFNEFHTNLDHPGNGQAMGTYIERYLYDAVGNILSMQHRRTNSANQGWTRNYTYNETSLIEPTKQSNRLSNTRLTGNNPLVSPYLHDAHGNIIRMPHLAKHSDTTAVNMHWDHNDQLQQVDLGGGGTAYYVYDAAGQRIRKVVEKSLGLTEERIYLGGFEIFRKRNGTGTITLERETLHVMDDQQRIALVETRTVDTNNTERTPAKLVRYQLGNHLGSASVELDDQAQLISYEEYYPYGSTSYQAVRKDIELPLKRYRYSGKERDEESGLYFYGARYYSSTLGRWTAVDPAGIIDSPNLYLYATCNPIIWRDPSGLASESVQTNDMSIALDNIHPFWRQLEPEWTTNPDTGQSSITYPLNYITIDYQTVDIGTVVNSEFVTSAVVTWYDIGAVGIKNEQGDVIGFPQGALSQPPPIKDRYLVETAGFETAGDFGLLMAEEIAGALLLGLLDPGVRSVGRGIISLRQARHLKKVRRIQMAAEIEATMNAGYVEIAAKATKLEKQVKLARLLAVQHQIYKAKFLTQFFSKMSSQLLKKHFERLMGTYLLPNKSYQKNYQKKYPLPTP